MKLIYTILFFFSITSFAGPMKELKDQEQLDSYFRESGFNGVLLVAKKNKILYKKAFGVKDFITNHPLSTEDIFQIGSVSKQFVAASLLKLQEEKKISIDDEIIKYLPELINFKGITIRDLLNHTSGVASYTDESDFFKKIDYNKILSLNDLINLIYKLPTEFEPKTNWNYSNSGYIIAGKIIEIASGLSWDQYIKINFFDPMGMKNSGYIHYFNQISDVIGHVKSEGNYIPVTDFNMSWALSAGGLYSTLDDLLKWVDIYDSSSLLSDNSKIEMQTPFKNNYALGVEVEKFNDEIKITHGGRTPGFVTNLTYLKSSGYKTVKFDNTDGGVVDTAALALDFYAKGSVSVVKLNSYPIEEAVLNDYVGHYQGDGMNLNLFVKDGNLFLQPDDGQKPYRLIANDKDSFRLFGIAGEEFIRDSNGKVNEIKHYQNGKVSIFKKTHHLMRTKNFPAVPSSLFRSNGSFSFSRFL